MRRLLIPGLLMAMAAGAAHAGKAHVHGVMALDIALDGPLLSVQLRSPQDSLVGHERRPRPGSESAAAATALAVLRDAPRWLRPDAAARCSAGVVTLMPGKLEDSSSAGGGEGDHADVEASVEWRCQTPAALKGVDVRLFEAFSRVHRIEVQVAGGNGPAAQTLRKGSARVRLAR